MASTRVAGAPATFDFAITSQATAFQSVTASARAAADANIVDNTTNSAASRRSRSGSATARIDGWNETGRPATDGHISTSFEASLTGPGGPIRRGRTVMLRARPGAGKRIVRLAVGKREERGDGPDLQDVLVGTDLGN